MYVLRTDDCIAAISSPAGRSARGILRVTGPSAIDLGTKCFASDGLKSLSEHGVWQLIPGRFRLEEGVAVPCSAVVFLPPGSYTGQPLVEFHLPGSPALLEMALRALIAEGARLAEPGEFTARAFLTGRIDLPAAEAVAEQISARSDAQLAAARQLAGGALSGCIASAMDELADLLSLVEAGIDFADEPVEFIDGGSLVRRLGDLEGRLGDLLARSIDMRRLEAMPRVGLVGPMSAGKSSLVNRLAGRDRAICSATPGTTRDVLSAVMDTPAGQIQLLDGPGLGVAGSPIDRQAQDAWRETLRQIDLALVVLSADQLYDTWLRSAGTEAAVPAPDALIAMLEAVAGRPYLVVLNKSDLLDPSALAAVCRAVELCAGAAVQAVSARTGQGCQGLQEAVVAAVAGGHAAGGGCVVLTARHGEALRAGLEAIGAAAGLAGGSEPAGELIALHLRDAAGHLGQITGQVTTEDLLERVFSRFCIGK